MRTGNLGQGQDGGGGSCPDEEAGEHDKGVMDAEVDAGEGYEDTREEEGGSEGGVDGGEGDGASGGGRRVPGRE